MSEIYEDEFYCPNCDKETPHECYDSGHERDSSGNINTCKVCGWYWSGHSGQYHPPLNSNEDD